MPEYYIASISWGKDSLAMLYKLLEENSPLDEVVFFDTGMEFNAIYKERDRNLQILKDANINYTELKPNKPFLENMFIRPVKKKRNKYNT